VSDTSHQLPKRCHFLTLNELKLRIFQLLIRLLHLLIGSLQFTSPFFDSSLELSIQLEEGLATFLKRVGHLVKSGSQFCNLIPALHFDTLTEVASRDDLGTQGKLFQRDSNSASRIISQ